MTHDDQIERPLDRRLLLRGGAVLAGAAGATVVGAALGPTAAQAADGANLLSGKANACENTTVLTIDGATGGPAPALSLVNKNGPGLRLNSLPDTFSSTLAVGDLAGSDYGPLVGVNVGAGVETSYLLTANDLALIPLATPRDVPIRRLDTRGGGPGLTNIVRKSSSTATDSSGRLTANSWIDVAIDPTTGPFEVTGAFLNMAVISPVANGYLTVYPPGDRPNTSTINFRTGVALSNAAFLSVGQFGTNYVVRVHSSQTTHVLLDYSGGVVNASSEPATLAAKSDVQRRAARQNKRATAMKAKLSRSVG